MPGTAGRSSDVDSRTIHIELLLPIIPNPSKYLYTRIEIAWNGEVEVLMCWAQTAISMWTIALIAPSHTKCLAAISAESNLAAAAVMIADALDVPVLYAACFPFSGWCPLWCAQ